MPFDPEVGLFIPDSAVESMHVGDGESDVAQAMAMRQRFKEIDARFDVVWAKRGSTIFPTAERWYLVRRSDEGRNSFWEINDGQGGYSPITEQHFARMQELDSAAHPGLWQRHRREQDEREKRSQKKLEDKSEEFREKLGERLKHEFDTQVPVTAAAKELLDG